MQIQLNIPPIQQIKSPILEEKQIQLFIKREDLIHQNISGNKWRKLKYNLEAAKQQGKTAILTFGGAFSNHIHAVAAAGQVFNFETIGIIRGERIEPLNTTLAYAEKCGMQLQFISRSDYRKKNDAQFLTVLQQQYPHAYIIPEGGTNLLALKGTSEIITELETTYDFYCSSCGTGGTLGGMIVGANHQGQLLGFSALKGGTFLQTDIQHYLSKYNGQSYSNWKIITDHHFGGYAKTKPTLIEFINNFKATHQIPLDPIYTGKMLYGIFDLIQKDYFPKESSILAIHTGGLQGIQGFNQRYGNILK